MTEPHTATPGPRPPARPPLRSLRTAGMPTADPEHAAELALQEAIGTEILRRRIAANLTQTALAERAHLPVATVRRYERGSVDPVYLLPLRAIAAALGTTPAALLSGPPSTPDSHARRPTRVLLPVQPGTGQPPAPLWRLVEYQSRAMGQRPEPPRSPDPRRTVPAPILTWASELLGERVHVLGSAAELTGHRSWYVGPADIAP